MDNIQKYIVGKYDNTTKDYHLLCYHLFDVGCVAYILLKNASNTIKNYIQANLGCKDYNMCCFFLAYIASLHDIGKANPYFINKIYGADINLFNNFKEKLSSSDLVFYDNEEEFFHAEISYLLLKRRRISLNLSRDMISFVADIWGMHHGKPVNIASFSNEFKSNKHMGTAGWKLLQQNLCGIMLRQFNKDKFDFSQIKIQENRTNGFKYFIAGLISCADWIASEHCRYYQDFSDDYFNSDWYSYYYEILKEYNFFDIKCIENNSISDYYPFIKNLTDAQQKSLDIASRMSCPGMIIIETLTGDGKTEAAGIAAKTLLDKGVNSGIYCAMPTQATSNAMFERMNSYIDKISSLKTDVQLIHGQGFLKDCEKGSENFHTWFIDNRRKMLSQYGVGTIDNLLASIISIRFFFLRLYGLAGKVVIIDEVHAYDTYMDDLLESSIEVLSELGCSVILLSATLPKNKLTQFIKAYGYKKDFIIEKQYPRITAIGSDSMDQFSIKGSYDRRIKIKPLYYKLDTGKKDVLNQIENKIKNGGNALLVANTVREAIDFYNLAIESGKIKNIRILHSRFRAKDKNDICLNILSSLGKGAFEENTRPMQSLTISTQVCEQSFDIDADVIFTQLAPIDIILQRLGRGQRFLKYNQLRPAGFKRNLNCYFLCPESLISEVDNINLSPWSLIYKGDILLKTWYLLKDLDSISVPADTDFLINNVYSDEYSFGEYTSEIKRIQDQTQINDRKSLQISGLSKVKIHPDDISGGGITYVEGETPSSMYVATRQVKYTLSFICLFKKNNDYYLCPARGEDFIINVNKKYYNLSEVKKILLNQVNITDKRIYDYYRTHQNTTLFQGSSKLKYYEVLIFDENNEVSISVKNRQNYDNILLTYDTKSGISIIKE